MTPAAPAAWGPDGDDTALARALHACGVPLGALQRALAEVRAARGSSPGEALALATSLLASGAVTPAQLEAARDHLAKTAVAPRPGPAVAPPSTFGPYRVVRELGRGGMGVVLEVEDAAGRRGALKTLIAGAEAELLARFQREARLHARLDHPHVAPVHAAELDATPPYLVQAFLTGGTLAERLAKGPLPPAEVAALGRKLAAGLQHAHERGVLHRDLKPANVLFDERGEPRIIDFGLARALDGASVRLTATGELLGTPSFIAPEVLTGAPVDERTDVHGLAGLLFAALTGRPPHDGVGLFGTLNAALLQDPPRAATLRPDVPAWLDEALARGLARDPADRPPTAAALGALLADREPPPPARGRRLAALAGVGALVAVVVGLLPARRPVAGVHPAAPDEATRAAAARAALVADLVDGRAPLPTTPAERSALAERLRSSGVADLGTASATLVDFLAGARRSPADVRVAVARLARGGPTPLTRAAAAPLWSGALAARQRNDVRGEQALAAAAALAGPDGALARAVRSRWLAHLEQELPDGDLLILVIRPAVMGDVQARARFVRIAEDLELVWRAAPGELPRGERLTGLIQLFAQTIRSHYRSDHDPDFPRELADLGLELHAAAPSDPLYAAVATLREPPDVASARLAQALRALEAAAPPPEPSGEVDFTFGVLQSAILALVIDRVLVSQRWEELAGRLETSLREGAGGPGAYEAYGRARVTLARQDPSRAEETSRHLRALLEGGSSDAQALQDWIDKVDQLWR